MILRDNCIGTRKTENNWDQWFPVSFVFFFFFLNEKFFFKFNILNNFFNENVENNNKNRYVTMDFPNIFHVFGVNLFSQKNLHLVYGENFEENGKIIPENSILSHIVRLYQKFRICQKFLLQRTSKIFEALFPH